MQYVLLAILLLVLLLLFLRFRVHIQYEDKVFTAYVKILFFRYSLYPGKESGEKKKKSKTADASASSAAPKETEKTRTFTDVMDIVDTVMTVLRDAKDRFLSALTVTAARVRIVIGSENPAKTAIVYGVVCQGVAYLFEYLNNITNLKTVRNAEIHVGYDFSSGESQTDIHIILSARTVGILAVALRALTSYFRTKSKKDAKNKLTKDGTKS